ncbi:MAG: hypothetical protein E6Q67_00270 [Roseateles sp.]|nr:MAG: hypothetical protein E6Q67_00270 [Roseateles sp.]
MKRLTLHPTLRSRRLQAGVTLVEALVAMLVMAIGMVALVGVMSNLRINTDAAKQRGEAMRLAMAEMAQLRAFSTLTKPSPAPAGVRDYDNDLASAGARQITLADANNTFTLVRTVAPLVAGQTPSQANSVRVQVTWVDRTRAQGDAPVLDQLVLDTIISRTDPAFSGTLAFPSPAQSVRLPSSRHPAIPAAAQDLGNHRDSALRPSSLGSTVWVFNNLTGVITSTCQIAAGTALTTAVVNDTNCTGTTAYALSGTVRFSNTSPPNPAVPEATAVPLSLYLDDYKVGKPEAAPSGLGTPQCFTDDSTPAQTRLNYSCIVYPSSSTPRVWSGQLLMATLPVGSSASTYRVCRYSADYNGNGRIDNEEHPARYVQVAGSLARQNFLVVRGDLACPTAPAVNLSTGVFADYSTLQLQPAP